MYIMNSKPTCYSDIFIDPSVVLPAGTIQISNSDGVAVSQGLQTLTMTNASPSTTSATGATIVQYAQGPDGQFFIPGTLSMFIFMQYLNQASKFLY